MNGEAAQINKKNYNLNSRQNSLPINLDGNKYQLCKRCSLCDVWIDVQTTWKYSVCVPYVDKLKNVKGCWL